MNASERYAARDRAHLADTIADVRTKLARPAPRPAIEDRERLAPLPPAGSGFPPGARVYIDGETIAIVRDFFPKGSTSYLFPHYRLDVPRGDRDIAVHVSRVGVVKRK